MQPGEGECLFRAALMSTPEEGEQGRAPAAPKREKRDALHRVVTEEPAPDASVSLFELVCDRARLSSEWVAGEAHTTPSLGRVGGQAGCSTAWCAWGRVAGCGGGHEG